MISEMAWAWWSTMGVPEMPLRSRQLLRAR
jgi:hypothetical protein